MNRRELRETLHWMRRYGNHVRERILLTDEWSLLMKVYNIEATIQAELDVIGVNNDELQK